MDADGNPMAALEALVPESVEGRSDQTSRQYLRLRTDILAGRFDRGSVLLETSLSAQYGVSRTPVREALNLLVHDGLLERADRGYHVRSGTPEDVVEIYAARIALEAEAASSAATRRTELDLARLEQVHRLCCTTDDPAVARTAHFRFHEVLWQAAHNATITAILVRLTTQLHIYDSGPPASHGEPAALNAEHAAILTALRERDEEAARREMRSHLERSRDQRIRAFAGG
ncbi:GntR family transcriptional regulator [Rhodococcus sp. X156]|uniref:GntR family transcriptional regulator n=1 Tax=Rhodococcus sp. X156 TaxID=2499145 RepID=UPI000FD8061D|nr:GntR family transcriptional regulator [Rhodococcus sp. X156]